MKRGIRNQSLFEAYVEYCFAPKHTVGEQLLDVRRYKRERAAYAAMETRGLDDEEEDEEESDGDDEGKLREDPEVSNRIRQNPSIECE